MKPFVLLAFEPNITGLCGICFRMRLYKVNLLKFTADALFFINCNPVNVDSIFEEGGLLQFP